MRTAVLVIMGLLLAGCSRAQMGDAPLVEAYPTLRFTQPVDLQASPDGSGRMFVVEQPGRIKVFDARAGSPVAATFLDLSGLIQSGGELGLLGLAFHPQFAQNRTFFVFYTRRGSASPYEEVVARYQAAASNSNAADPATGEIVLRVPDPLSNHNGGQLQFGHDGYLYVALGDGGGSGDPQGNGQNTGTLLGSILRLDVDNRAGSLAPECDAQGAYRVPADNPFAGSTAGCGEIFVYGLRNPWRFSVEKDGFLTVADVGQNAWEEVNRVRKGENLGWNVMEGAHCYKAATCDTSGKTMPVHEYGHNSSGGFSITGGYFQPATTTGCSALTGRYVFGDYVTRHIWALTFRTGPYPPHVDRLVDGATQGVAVSTFGLDPDGRMLVADHSGGRLMAFNCETLRLPLTSESGGKAPAPISLASTGPTPFATNTTLRLTTDRPRRVTVAAYDVLGREVARLFDGVAASTEALLFEGTGLGPGVYVVQAWGDGGAAAVRVVRGR